MTCPRTACAQDLDGAEPGELRTVVDDAGQAYRGWELHRCSGPHGGTSRCRACDAPILWVESARTGRRIPLDPQPIVLELSRPGLFSRRAWGRESHFATCPEADRFRGRGSR